MSRAVYERRRGYDDRADRGAETFAKAHGNAIETVTIFLKRARARGNGFPEACAIEVELYRWVLLACPGGDGAAVREREDGTAESIFEGDEPRWGEMVVVFEYCVFFNVGEGYVMAVGWRNRYGHSATDTRNTACFPDCCVNDYGFIFFVKRRFRAGR